MSFKRSSFILRQQRSRRVYIYIYIYTTSPASYFPKHFSQLFSAVTNNATGVALPGNAVTERKS